MKYQIILCLLKNIVNLDFIKICVIIFYTKDIATYSHSKFAENGLHKRRFL